MLKDATIPDQAALRTAVAQKVLEQVRSPSLAGVSNFHQRFVFHDLGLWLCDFG